MTANPLAYGTPQYGGGQQSAPPGAAPWQPPRLSENRVNDGYADQPTNLLALLALLVAASAWFLTGPLGTIGGAIMGFIALKQIKDRGEQGRDLALWALVLAAASVIVGILLIVGLVVFIGNMPLII